MRLDFLQDCWWSKAALKPKSSTTPWRWDDEGRLAISKRLLTGLRLIFLFMDFPEETLRLLAPGVVREGTLLGTYSTRPYSTTLEILTPDRDPESSEDGLMPATAYHCSWVSLTALRPSIHSLIHARTIFSHHLRTRRSLHLAPGFKNGTNCDAVTNCCRLSRHSDARVGKKIPWVKCGLLTKSWTQSRTPRTSSSQIITRSRLMMNLSLEVTGPRRIRAISWNTWNDKTGYFRLKQSQGFTILVTILFLNRCWRARKPACREQNDRTSPTLGRLLVGDRSSCRCSWTNDRYSARQASTSLLSIHPRSKSPSSKIPSRFSGAWSSPPMTMAGQKQLNPCPILERAATVDSTEFVNSSKKFRASRWNSRFEYEVLILLRAANTRVPDKNSPSAIGGNFEWFASTYCSHCSTRGSEDPCLTFWRRQ